MSEWHVTPEYINQNWTPEIIHLMVEKRNQRVMRLTAGLHKEPSTGQSRRVSDSELFVAMGLSMQSEGKA